MSKSDPLTEESPSVQAILVLVADKSKPEYAFIALVPIILFLALDSYYLALEKAFRDSYNEFIGKLHYQSICSEDLFSVVPQGNMTTHQIAALKSFSVWGFYVCLGVMVYLAKELVL